MSRHRRRRSSFSRRADPRRTALFAGGGAVILIGLFVFFIIQADRLAPEPREISIDLPDAFKE